MRPYVLSALLVATSLALPSIARAQLFGMPDPGAATRGVRRAARALPQLLEAGASVLQERLRLEAWTPEGLPATPLFWALADGHLPVGEIQHLELTDAEASWILERAPASYRCTLDTLSAADHEEAAELWPEVDEVTQWVRMVRRYNRKNARKFLVFSDPVFQEYVDYLYDFTRGLNMTHFVAEKLVAAALEREPVMGREISREEALFQLACYAVVLKGGQWVTGKVAQLRPGLPTPRVAGTYVGRPQGLPQGMDAATFARFSRMLREGAGEIPGVAEISSRVSVQGSRASGTARPSSDIDVAVLVDGRTFDQLVGRRIGRPSAGSAKERTVIRAAERGKLDGGRAGLRRLRKALEAEFGYKVDLSVIRIGGAFDQGAMIPLVP